MMFTYPAVLDADDALAALKQAVLTHGYDYSMDHGCYYVLDGQPRCLVGVALAQLGIPVTGLFGPEGSCKSQNGNPITSGNVQAALETVGVRLSDNTIAVFAAAQDVQDNYKTWGQALCAATERRLEQVRYDNPPF